MWGMRSIDDQMMITELRAGLLCLSERLHLHRLDPSISRSIEVGTASPCIQSQGGGGRKPNRSRPNSGTLEFGDAGDLNHHPHAL